MFPYNSAFIPTNTLFLTTSGSCVSNPVSPLSVNCLCEVECQLIRVWLVSLSRPASFQKTNSSLSSHHLPVAPQVGMGHQKTLLCSNWSVGWLDLVQVLCIQSQSLCDHYNSMQWPILCCFRYLLATSPTLLPLFVAS